MIAELDTLRGLGWRNEVFIVDDNFIGNSDKPCSWRANWPRGRSSNGRPFSFYTEASIDLADRPELMAAMVEANFMYVFIGIETPSAEALKELEEVSESAQRQPRTGPRHSGKRAVGAGRVHRRLRFRRRDHLRAAARIHRAARPSPGPWPGVLQAPPTTALYDRMKKEGRLIEDSEATSNFSAPNFRTMLPLPVLLRGLEPPAVRIV